MRYVSITSQALSEMSAALCKMTGIIWLDLSHNQIGASGVKVIASALDVLRKLEHLNLASNAISTDGMKLLVASFHPALVDLNLADNDIGPDGIGALAQRVKDNAVPNLTRVDLSKNRMTQALHAPRLSEGIGKAKFLLSGVSKQLVAGGGLGEARKQLLMAGDDSTKRGLALFASACAAHLLQLKEIVIHKNIQVGVIRNAHPSLDLSGIDFQVQDITMVSEMLRYNKSVTSVNFSRNDLNEGGYAISEWMQQATQLQSLDLSHVKLGDTGLAKIAVGLTPLIYLTNLTIPNNNIGENGIKFLSPALKALGSLQILDLSHNPLTLRHVGHVSGENYYSEGVRGFATSLATCVKLHELDLSHCTLGDEGAEAVAIALQVCVCV